MSAELSDDILHFRLGLRWLPAEPGEHFADLVEGWPGQRLTISCIALRDKKRDEPSRSLAPDRGKLRACERC